MTISPTNQTQSQWAAPEKTNSESGAKINQLTSDMKKDQSQLVELNKEYVQYVSKGDEDMARLKSAVIQQKQLEVTLTRAKITKLKNSETQGADSSSRMDSIELSSAQKTTSSAQETGGSDDAESYGEQPAGIVELSPYAKSLLSSKN